jgi:hypothetical protein
VAAEELIEAVIETPQALEPPAPTPPVWAKPAERAVQPITGRTSFFARAVKGTAPGEPQAAQPAPAAPAGPAQADAVEGLAPDRPELESLSLPKDGLSRQWLEFVNQLSAAKPRLR